MSETPEHLILSAANRIRLVRCPRLPAKQYRARHLDRAVCVVRRYWPHGEMPNELRIAPASLGHYANDPRSPRRVKK